MSGTPELLDVTETPVTSTKDVRRCIAMDNVWRIEKCLQNPNEDIGQSTFILSFLLPFPGPLAADLACACEEELYPLL